MEETIFNYISATFGISLAFAIAILGIAFWLTYYVTKKTIEIRKDHSAFTSSHERLTASVEEIRRDMAAVKGATSDLNEMRRDIAYLKGSMDIIRSHDDLMRSHSPISLTEEGKKVAAELDADRLIGNDWPLIRSSIMESGLTEDYDIQQFCLETASVEPEKFFQKETIEAVKRYAYNNGKPVQLYYRVLGLLIRDRFLSQK
ncbi:MAG: hypothetical protein K2J27_07875 [Duncaniella sp.]|nr:hypothetical protein [Duncaniella sp.]